MLVKSAQLYTCNATVSLQRTYQSAKLTEHHHRYAASGCARFRLHKSTSASKLGARGSCNQRYYSALLNILEAKSLNDRRAVDWAALHDKQSACAIFLRKLHETATSAQRSIGTQQLVPRHPMSSEPVILQRSFLSWDYMQFFALKHIEGQRTRLVSESLQC